MIYEDPIMMLIPLYLAYLGAVIIVCLVCRRHDKRHEQRMTEKKVTIHAVHEHDMVEFLTSCELTEEIEKNEFICAGCGRTMKIDEIAYIKPVQSPPTVELYGDECGFKVRSG